MMKLGVTVLPVRSLSAVANVAESNSYSKERPMLVNDFKVTYSTGNWEPQTRTFVTIEEAEIFALNQYNLGYNISASFPVQGLS